MPRNYLYGDPYWTKAPAVCHCTGCGKEIKPRSKIFFYPLTGAIYDKDCGKDAYEEFKEAAEREYAETGALDYEDPSWDQDE